MENLTKNRLKQLASYRLAKNCEADNVFVVEGSKMGCEALLSGYEVLAVCGSEEWLDAHAAELGKVQSCYAVSRDELERLSMQRTPNKVWMLLSRDSGNAIPKPSMALTLVLDGLQDPGNMGTIIRTSDWYGIRHIVCSRDTVSCYNPKVVQSTMGSLFRTKIDYCNLADWLDAASASATIYGAMLDGSNIYTAELEAPAIMVIGNEGSGISESIKNTIGHRLTIPNRGGTCESLNAAVATAIACSEFSRRLP